MNEAQPKTPLFPAFDPVTAQTWEDRIRKDLRDTPYESLLWKTDENLTVKPFYTRQDLPENQAAKPDDYPFVRTTKASENAWVNVQTIYVRTDSRPFIEKAAEALQRGASGIHFILKEPISFNFDHLFAQPATHGAFISFTFPVSPETYLKEYLDRARANNFDLNLLRGFIQYQPVDDMPFHSPPYSNLPEMLELVKDASGLYPITISGQQFSDHGCLLNQEIALVLSATVSVLDYAQEKGIAPEKIMGRIAFNLSSGTNYFFEIAKLRALRLLWSALVNSYGLPGELASRLHIHASTSRWYQTVFDPHVNLLRGTTEAMSAVLGGCDSLSVAPFDILYKTPDDLSERISRNISVILKEEAYLDKAVDPAAGSYYLERLTQEMAEKAWEFFQELEAKGGFRKALDTGFISKEINEVAARKFKALASREQILVGTNKYPNLNERTDFDPQALIMNKHFDSSRAAYPFEIMRLASEIHFSRKKKKASASIIVIGTRINEHIHANFAKEFFDCANFDTEVYHFESVDDASETLQKNDSNVVVMSGSEEQYKHFDKELATKIKEGENKPALLLAATPEIMQKEMLENGFDEFLYVGGDMDTIISCVQEKVLREGLQLD